MTVISQAPHTPHRARFNPVVQRFTAAAGNIYRRVSSILTEQTVGMTWTFGSGNPIASTNGRHIQIDWRQPFDDAVRVGDFATATTLLRGIVYHETGHMLFTTRDHEFFAKIGRTGTLRNSWNVLEDQRIETLLLSRYPAMAPYLRSIVAAFLLSGEESLTTFLLHGRRYLSKSLRTTAANAAYAAHDPIVVDRMHAIIDEFRMMGSVTQPGALDKMYDLSVEFDGLMRSISPDIDMPTPHDPTTEPPRGGEAQEQQPAPESDEDGDGEATDDGEGEGKGSKPADEESDDATDDGSGDGQDDDSGESGDDSGDASDGQGGTTDDEAESAKPYATESESDGGDSDDGNPGDGAGSGHKGQNTNRTVADEAKEEAERGMKQARPQAEEEAGEIRQWIEENLILDCPPSEHRGSFTPDPESVSLSRDIASEVSALRNAHTDGWIKDQDYGSTVGIGGMIRNKRNGDMDIFTRWDTGSLDATTMEVVLLVDTSLSMQTSFFLRPALLATWAIKRACDELDVTCTVFSFDGNGAVVYGPNDKADKQFVPNIVVGGSTDPTAALLDAQRIFAASREAHKLLVILTDGEWFIGQTSPDRMLREFAANGVSTVLVGLDDAVAKYGTHGCMTAQDIADPRDLVGIVRRQMDDFLR